MCKSAPAQPANQAANEIDESSITEVGFLNINGHSGGPDLLSVLELVGFIFIALLLGHKLYQCWNRRTGLTGRGTQNVDTFMNMPNAIPMQQMEPAMPQQQQQAITYHPVISANRRSFQSFAS